MEAFHWNPCFITGLTEVDSQHRRLVDVINQFGNLVMRQEGASIAALDPIFAELAAYAQHHFVEEEALMMSVGLDARHVEQHRKSHASFLDEVTRLHGSASADNLDAEKSLLQFLTHWLAYHILGSDQLMARQIASVQAGCRPEDAYLADTRTNDPATDTLLQALNGLFQQVSERNRELVQLNKTLETRVAQRTQALTDANRQLDDLANTDMLTGLPNRRYALRRLALEWDAALRDGTPLACMMIDADGFKAINDIHGHNAGDAVLRELSMRLRHAVRTDDNVCRLGGDEFLIICANTPLDGALKLAETIRREIAALRVPAGKGEWRGSISVGVAVRTAAMTGLDDLMKAADLAVYAAKRNGRNCVATAGQ
ncbi:MAG: GGDEF domain-containing protein [Sulfuritalea sp.]|jgi:diguanylate cyclase (GGDEF)-like protein/hemerythrin-like metal-binding protein|nr:GGDEF domain-containing protein [Sulfuritalea sp.]